MTRGTVERLSYIAAHRLLGMESHESQRLTRTGDCPGTQFATPGKLRSVAVDRIAEVIADVFDGAEQAELANMMLPEPQVASKRQE